MGLNDYNFQHLIKDPDFIKWVKWPDQRTDEQWQSWLKKNPDKKRDVEEARKFIQLMNFKTDFPNSEDYAQVWQRIQSTNAPTKEKVSFGHGEDLIPTKKFFVKKWFKWAAVFTGLLIFGATIYLSSGLVNITRQSTNYGQTSSIQLPDGSEVMLNANSSIRYYSNWQLSGIFSQLMGGNSKEREVWLQGEAFFNIKKVNNQSANDNVGGEKFIVHTGNLDVEVLGTKFNVNNRRGKTQVVLNSGKIKLKSNINIQGEQQLFMEPGQLVEISKTDNHFLQKKVNPEHYSAWRKNKMVFNDTPLQEIALRIEDNFGYPVKFNDENLKNRTFTASIPKNDLNILLKLLEESFGLEISIKNKTIMVQKRNPGNKGS